jgi:hypothetical protein
MRGICLIFPGRRARMRACGIIMFCVAFGSGGYCGVRWDSGHLDVCLFTGMQGEYHLVSENSVRLDYADGDELVKAVSKLALPEVHMRGACSSCQNSLQAYAPQTMTTLAPLEMLFNCTCTGLRPVASKGRG